MLTWESYWGVRLCKEGSAEREPQVLVRRIGEVNQHEWRNVLALGALAVATYAFVPEGLPRDLSYVGIGVLWTVLAYVGLRRLHPEPFTPWLALIAGQALTVTGDLIWLVYTQQFHRELPVPSVADVPYLAGYPFLTLGLLLIVRARTGRNDRAGVLDASIITLGIGVATWVFLIEPSSIASATPLGERLVALAYPLMDLLLLAMTARLFLTPGARPPALVLLTLSLTAALIADTFFVESTVFAATFAEETLDLLWLSSYVLLAVAIWHPTVAKVAEPAAFEPERLSYRRFAALSFAATLAPVAICFQAMRDAPMAIPMIVCGSAALVVCTLLRASQLVRQLESSLDRRLVAENELRVAEARYRQLVEQIPAALYLQGPDLLRPPLYVSPRIQEILGYPASDWLEKPGFWTDCLHPDDRDRVLRDHERASDTLQPLAMEYRIFARDGRVVWIRDEALWFPSPDGDGGYWQGLILDITERKRVEEELEFRAFHDPLTGLPNRALFLNRLEHALARSREHGDAVAVLFLDLDRFKLVNDSLGHEAGDQLLTGVAQRLASNIRTGDMVARFGGDEFTILLEQVQDVGEATRVAERLIEALDTPFTIAGREVNAATSIGIAVGAGQTTSAADFLRDADSALYRAKVTKRGSFLVFEPAMAEEAIARLEFETALRQAVRDDQIRVHYQPIIDLRDGRLVGVEALARWKHPTRGLLGPAEFIPLAEEMGLIAPLGICVLETACRHLRAWQDEFPEAAPETVTVNLSPLQLARPDLIDDIKRILAETRLSPWRLQLEITERTVLDSTPELVEQLGALKALGLRLAIDDFGAGHAGFSSLKHRSIDTLKIDRGVIAGLGVALEDSALVQALIDFAKMLRLTVVAEGIERSAQAQTLRDLGCDLGQGRLFDGALPPQALRARLASGKRWDVGSSSTETVVSHQSSVA